MISKEELKRIARETGLSLYQQEKDYLLKLFLYYYYKRFSDAVFKGGTCLKYILGIPRFSEDLDFNVKKPKQVKEQIRTVIGNIGKLGIASYFIKEEMFSDAYTCEIGFHGPLWAGTPQTQNKFRIDAGYRTGTLQKTEWKLVKSEYPETGASFLVLTMAMEEMMAEKLIALQQRHKGRDLYDIWFLKNSGVTINTQLLHKKKEKEGIQGHTITLPTKQEYERDLSRLTTRVIPYEQAKKEIEKMLEDATK